jgi:hypothetical protein
VLSVALVHDECCSAAAAGICAHLSLPFASFFSWAQGRARLRSPHSPPLTPHAAHGMAAGGKARIALELRTLVSSYDTSALAPAALQHLAVAGFAEIAAAVAARAESQTVSAAHTAVFTAVSGGHGGKGWVGGQAAATMAGGGAGGELQAGHPSLHPSRPPSAHPSHPRMQATGSPSSPLSWESGNAALTTHTPHRPPPSSEPRWSTSPAHASATASLQLRGSFSRRRGHGTSSWRCASSRQTSRR